MSTVAAPPPLWVVTPEKVQTAVARIIAAVQPLRIIAFGSRARGEARVDSDLDLLVVLPRGQNVAGVRAHLHGLMEGLIFPVDIITIDEDQFAERRHWLGSVYYEAALEGVDLYANGTADPHLARQVSR